MAQIEQLDKNRYRLTGQLNFSTVTAVLTQVHALTLENEVSFDLSMLENSNSAGLALLIELITDARRQNRKITFTGLPDTLLDLAEMSNVKHLLVN
ncbi:MAG: STAS domain-containing protein [Gammaproteobacteria bacterium]|nr:STAS domain-containing protein [Gammaproteobacteria bacterium]